VLDNHHVYVMSQCSRTLCAVIVGSKMTTEQQMSVVRVIWHDAHSVGAGWQPIDDIDDEPCVVESVGFLLPESKAGHIVISQSITDDQQTDHILAVPVAMIQMMQVLSVHSVGVVSPSP
jgi:hypothetical protein